MFEVAGDRGHGHDEEVAEGVAPQGALLKRYCGSSVGWRLSDGRWKCGRCDRKVPATAGTIFDKIRTPRAIWFATAWLMGNGKTGASATRVRRELEPGSYLTAWAMLRGDVEVEPVRVRRHEHWGGPGTWAKALPASL